MRLKMSTIVSNWQTRRIWYCQSILLTLFDILFTFTLKKAWSGNFSFDSNSANDKWQPQIIFIHQCCTRIVDSSRGVLLLGWSWTWRQLLSDYHYYFKQTLYCRKRICLLDLLVSENCSPVLMCSSHWSFEKLLANETAKTHFLELIHGNGVEKS